MFDLYRQVLKKGIRPGVPASIKQIRMACLNNDKKLNTRNPGAGSHRRGLVRRVRDIARISGSGEKTCSLLYALTQYYRPEQTVELGTSLGLGTLCLAGPSEGRVFTFEANDDVADVAEENFKSSGLNNIALIRGDIDRTLPQFVSEDRKIDMVFIDANHTEKALVRYFEMLLPVMSAKGLMVVDDIRWSPGMYRGWKRLADRNEVALSVDLLRQGLLIFKPDFHKAHYYIEY
jgi:predicted O-methyltransferase YrrM